MSYWTIASGGELIHIFNQGPATFEYKTYDSKGNHVIVRYNYDHLEKVLAAKENVRRYCHG